MLRVGFTEPYSHLHAGALLPHRFILTRVRGRFDFCGTFLGVASTGRYPAPCPKELGLSSGSQWLPAITQPTCVHAAIIVTWEPCRVNFSRRPADPCRYQDPCLRRYVWQRSRFHSPWRTRYIAWCQEAPLAALVESPFRRSRISVSPRVSPPVRRRNTDVLFYLFCTRAGIPVSTVVSYWMKSKKRTTSAA